MSGSKPYDAGTDGLIKKIRCWHDDSSETNVPNKKVPDSCHHTKRLAQTTTGEGENGS